MRRRNVSAPAASASPAKAIIHGSPPVGSKVLSPLAPTTLVSVVLDVIVELLSTVWLLTAPGAEAAVLPGAPIPGAPTGADMPLEAP